MLVDFDTEAVFGSRMIFEFEVGNDNKFTEDNYSYYGKSIMKVMMCWDRWRACIGIGSR